MAVLELITQGDGIGSAWPAIKVVFTAVTFNEAGVSVTLALTYNLSEK